ncbi:MAG: hypothetical protein CFH10_00943 [Alphaproteobacteria bacterium MarineAlpha4_Bin2]|nr:MAG: hypothetical protein CFH10_00943 [Alphaproteobacteria bacterium MarineAlpha4_Bin2]
MTRDSTDASEAQELTAEQVVNYLRRHPDFLAQHPNALNDLLPPERALGDSVADFQSAMIARLRADVAGHTDRQRELIDTSRANLTIQTRVHECVLALLAARSFEQVIETITTDLTVLLDLDIVTFGIESEDESWCVEEAGQGLRVVEPGTVEALFGETDELVLGSSVEGRAEAFGEASDLVRSEALVRLEISPTTPPAFIAFGSRDPDKFYAGQATEMIGFLAAVLESVIRGWLSLPR